MGWPPPRPLASCPGGCLRGRPVAGCGGRLTRGRPLLVVKLVGKTEDVVAVGTVDGGDNCRYPRPAPQPLPTGDVSRNAAGIGLLCAVVTSMPNARTLSPARSRLCAGSPELFPRVVHRLCAEIAIREPIYRG